MQSLEEDGVSEARSSSKSVRPDFLEQRYFYAAKVWRRVHVRVTNHEWVFAIYLQLRKQTGAKTPTARPISMKSKKLKVEELTLEPYEEHKTLSSIL